MTELFETDDVADHRWALTATGLIRTFNEAGVLTAADVHLGTRLGRLLGEGDERVHLAVALTSRAVRHGSVCVDLATIPLIEPDLPWPAHDGWVDAVTASPLLAQGVLRWEFDLLYLDRYRQEEAQVWDDLRHRAQRPAPRLDDGALEAALARVFPEEGYAEQRAASRQAAQQWTTVLTGGPGTGKTTTVAGLLTMLAEQHELTGRAMRIALAAPTGKAAARLQEAVLDSASRLSPADAARLGSPQASTLHRLLGFRPDNTSRYRHDRSNRLPHDIVVVDETSMVSLTMMARLLEAVRPDARLILVGDPDQLASVDAGAVLHDLVTGFEGRSDSPVVALTATHRFGEHIGALAAALRAGDAEAALEVLRAGHREVEWVTDENPASGIRRAALPAALAVRDAALHGSVDKALAALDRHRLLCAHRDGPHGVRHWNRQIEHWITEETGDSLHARMYPGRPLLVTANDYGLGVYNGDTGVVVVSDHRLRAAVAGSGGALDFAPTRLADVETMHAMTIHKSQGSQAHEVTVLLPDADSRILTRELFYTAVTRAQDKVRVVGTEASVRAAISRRVQRASGLRNRLQATAGSDAATQTG